MLLRPRFKQPLAVKHQPHSDGNRFLRVTGLGAALLLCGVIGYEYVQVTSTPALLRAANAATPQVPVGVKVNNLPAQPATPAATIKADNPPKPQKPVAAAPPLRWGNGVLRETESEAAPSTTSKRASPAPRPQVPPSAPLPFAHMLELAWKAYQQGNYALARERYEQVMDGENNTDVQLGLGAIALRQHRNTLAIHYFQQALTLDPRNTTALAALATLGDERASDDVETHIKQLLDQQSSPGLQFSLGNFYAGQQRWREAEAAYFESYQADTHNADYAYNLAISLDYLRLYPQALTYYLKARELALSGSAHIDAVRLNNRIQQLQEQLTP